MCEVWAFGAARGWHHPSQERWKASGRWDLKTDSQEMTNAGNGMGHTVRAQSGPVTINTLTIHSGL